MRKIIAGLVVLAAMAFMFVPSVSFTEDRNTVQLARTIYALGKSESYETKLALGTVVMNRVKNPWFADDLGEVLRDQQQFPAGNRYDGDSLRAAHAVLSGRRSLPGSALYYQAADATGSWDDANRIIRVGGYNFYSESGSIQ